MRMIYGLLGELEIGRDDQFMALPSGHSLIVLAALLVNANRRMSKAQLLRAAWGGAEVSEAQLHKSVAALRALLGQLGRRGDLVTHTRQGYEMRVPDDDLDTLLFQRLVRQAEQAESEHRTDDEIGHLRRALRLWRGPHPLSNVPGDAFRPETAGLEQRRKRAGARLFDLEIALRHYDRVLDGLLLLVAYYPTDRRLSEQLMVALYRCGHVTDAISAYERYAERLEEETGGKPDPALRELYYAVGRGDEAVVATAESGIARRAGIRPRPESPGPETRAGRILMHGTLQAG
jgi:DNA-binding SARP family transcriptional activator